MSFDFSISEVSMILAKDGVEIDYVTNNGSLKFMANKMPLRSWIKILVLFLKINHFNILRKGLDTRNFSLVVREDGKNLDVTKFVIDGFYHDHGHLKPSWLSRTLIAYKNCVKALVAIFGTKKISSQYDGIILNHRLYATYGSVGLCAVSYGLLVYQIQREECFLLKASRLNQQRFRVIDRRELLCCDVKNTNLQGLQNFAADQKNSRKNIVTENINGAILVLLPNISDANFKFDVPFSNMEFYKRLRDWSIGLERTLYVKMHPNADLYGEVEFIENFFNSMPNIILLIDDKIPPASWNKLKCVISPAGSGLLECLSLGQKPLGFARDLAEDLPFFLIKDFPSNKFLECYDAKLSDKEIEKVKYFLSLEKKYQGQLYLSQTRLKPKMKLIDKIQIDYSEYNSKYKISCDNMPINIRNQVFSEFGR